MTAELRYGSWPSPITSADLAAAGVRLSAGVLDDDARYWTEGRPADSGRVSLWRQIPGREPIDVAPGAYVRNSVNEYGGGAWAVRDGLVAFCSWPDGAVHLVEDGADRILVAAAGLRFAALQFAPAHRLLLAVREDHRDSDAQPEQTVVALDLDDANPDGGRVLARGADFYAHPSLSADGRLAWCEWDHPNMPWDTTRIKVAPLSDPASTTLVAGAQGVSALYPAWDADGGLIHLSDVSGWWNFHRWTPGGDRTLYQAPNEFCGPLWSLDPVPYALIGPGLIGCWWLADGIAKLGVLHFDPAGVAPSEVRGLDTPAVAVELSGSGPTCLALLGYSDRPDELVELDWDSGAVATVRASAQSSGAHTGVSAAQAFTWASPDGPVHAWYYPPTSAADCQAPDDELPPAVLLAPPVTEASGPRMVLS